MDTEKEIVRDIWLFLKAHSVPPNPGSEAAIRFWNQTADEISRLVSGKWANHPLAVEMGMAVYYYLDIKSRMRS